MRRLGRHLNLQAKISLVLVAVILPTFLIVTIAQNKFTFPLLEGEIRQIGINAGKTLAAEILSGRWLARPNPAPVIENAIQEIIYSQPDIIRIDVMVKDSNTGNLKVLASNMDDDPSSSFPSFVLPENITTEFKSEDSMSGTWDIHVPIEQRSRDPRGPKRSLGLVHVLVSTKLIGRIVGTLWKTTAGAASLSVITLILVLSYFLRKTIANDRLLQLAETQNLQLTEQLHDIQRQLMTMEKLAVMGQLTASFAHEIGTPLNAIGGHLQLLKEEIPSSSKSIEERFEIVNGQVNKIEQIVKGFLQSTTKPTSQKQLVDMNLLVDRTLGIVNPRMDALGVEVVRKFNRDMGPIRVVPLDIEQVLLNLLNNSLDSLRAKSKLKEKSRLQLEISTEVASLQGRQWAQVSVYDTGEGIRKSDLEKVLKPFFTTKRPGEGTGLGLAICEQLVHKYGGELFVDSKEGVWARVSMRIPYYANL
jgi:signal transduction histidine kinase